MIHRIARKMIILSVTLTVILAIPLVASAQSESVNISYNDIQIAIDGMIIAPKDGNGKIVEPFIINGTTYLPIRAMGEAFGKAVNWDGMSSSVIIGSSPANTENDGTGVVKTVIGKTGNSNVVISYKAVQIYVDGVKISPKDGNGKTVDPFIINGTTYLPVRAVGEAFGKSVNWDGETNSVLVAEKSLEPEASKGIYISYTTEVLEGTQVIHYDFDKSNLPESMNAAAFFEIMGCSTYTNYFAYSQTLDRDFWNVYFPLKGSKAINNGYYNENVLTLLDDSLEPIGYATFDDLDLSKTELNLSFVKYEKPNTDPPIPNAASLSSDGLLTLDKSLLPSYDYAIIFGLWYNSVDFDKLETIYMGLSRCSFENSDNDSTNIGKSLSYMLTIPPKFVQGPTEGDYGYIIEDNYMLISDSIIVAFMDSGAVLKGYAEIELK